MPTAGRGRTARLPSADVVRRIRARRTPSAIVNRLHAELARTVQAPESKAKLVEMGVDDTVKPTPEDFTAMVRSELAYFGKLVKEAGIKLTE